MNRTYSPPVYRALEGEIIKQTEKAILFRVLNKQTGEEVKQDWFPKSQLASFGGNYDEIDGTFNYILASEWILGQKALLSVSIPRDLIKIIPKETQDTRAVGFNPNYAKPYTGVTKQDRANRAPFKDDEGPSVDMSPADWDAYYNNTGDGD